MTHPHGDHTGLANRFLKDYAGKIEIDVAGYNLPDFDSYACCYDAQWEKRCVMPFCEEATELYGAETFVMHSGQRMHLPGCELEVIYTQEDYFPELFASANHLSCAFRMTFADTGRSAVILGDCEKQLCKGMAEAYGAALKSDILQLTHHGSNGGDLDLYRNIDPEFCFWALDGWRFDVRTQMRGLDDGYIFNRYLRDTTIRDRKHYTCDETVTLKV
jgi:beta-lactamase superfamily II metal-dependent hydrolase